jgi:hypothetical protein
MRLLSRILALAFSCLLLLAISVVSGEEESHWFDMENCGFCKHLTEDPDLLPNTIWEHHKISNGLVSVTTVKPEFMGSHMTAMQKMEEVGKKMEAGEPVTMCNYCKAYGDLMAAGAKIEYVATKTGNVILTTSNDEAVVAKIHEFGQKTIDELAKFEKMESEKVVEPKEEGE